MKTSKNKSNRFEPRPAYHYFAILLLCLFCLTAFGHSGDGMWDEIIGKRVVNYEGVTLGHVSDTAVDLEHGRCLGLFVKYGGVLGIGSRTIMVPLGAWKENETPRTLFVNMSKDAFQNAPIFKMSKKLGPPEVAQVAAVFRYFGQQPYFSDGSIASPSSAREPLGFVQRSSRILYLPVDNLQGKSLASVWGIRGLNSPDGRIKGVVLMPSNYEYTGNYKIVQPQALRYNSKHTRLRLNDHQQEFRDSPLFISSFDDSFREESPVRPGNPRASLVQGNSHSDKRITTQINRHIRHNLLLSHYARTLEVGTVNGKTIIHGRVETIEERNKILAYANQAAGANNVSTDIEVREMSSSEYAIDRHHPSF